MIFRLLKPPDDVFRTVGVTSQALSFGIIIWVTLNAFAVLKIAPKFCGSWIWSKINTMFGLSFWILPKSKYLYSSISAI